MSHGILARRSPMRGLSGYVSTIPAECWAQAGFKDCNAAQYNVAKSTCQAGLMDNDACIGPLADKLSMTQCKCTKKAAAAPKAVVTTSKVPTTAEPFEPASAGLFGMDSKTLMVVGLVGVGLFMFLGGDSKKKGSS